MLQSKKAQSTLEYVIILTAIVAAVIIASKGIGIKVKEGLGGTDGTTGAANAISTACTKIGDIN